MKKLLSKILGFVVIFGFCFGVSLAGDKEIFLKSERISDNRIRLDVNMSDLGTPILGLAFHLVFDSEAFRYVDYQVGDFLESGGDKPIYLVRGTEDGKVIVGVSLKRGDVLPFGSGRVISFVFEGDADPQFAGFRFESTTISSLGVQGRKDLDNVSWRDFQLPVAVAGDNGTYEKMFFAEKNFDFWSYVLGGGIVFLLVAWLVVEKFLKK